MESRELIFLRHAQQHGSSSSGSVLSMGTGLTRLGRQQADLTARRLKSEGIEDLHHSPFERARETSRIVGNQLPGLNRHETRALGEIIPPYPANWGPAQTTPARDIRERLDKLIERFFHATRGHFRRELFVSHGNLIRCLLCHILHIPRERWLLMDIQHASLTTFLVTQQKEILLLSFNDVGHLPHNLRTREAAS